MIAWHYTTGRKLPLIQESGVLRPTDAGIGPDERPVLWFSTAPYWEPTSAKGVALSMKERIESGSSLPSRTLSMQENAEMGEGLYRFGWPAARLIRWPEIGKRAGIRAWLRNSLMKVGREQGANPAEWCGTFEKIPVDGLLFQQLVDFRRWETKEKIARREAQLLEISQLQIPVQVLPLEELQQEAGKWIHQGKGATQDKLCVDYARHRLTNYHQLLERFDAGDLDILTAIRARVYSAIAVVYPQLLEECMRQLADRSIK